VVGGGVGWRGGALGTADTSTLETGCLHVLSCCPGASFLLPARARRVLEHTATTGLVERGPPLPPFEHLGDLLIEAVLLLPTESHAGLEDDPSFQPPVAIGEGDLRP